ncbi:helix-turn-helix transcriptional regulator [Neptuniibacter pectenicola]|uniref:helix-turn-helix transcriptional regulator n=1 Tax=Neptuniibacter pectenicola TaxID=1806669 RepID=UPI003C6E1AB5
MNDNEEYVMRLIKLKEVMNNTGLGRSTIYKYVAEGEFPKPVSLGARAVAWVESEVDDWVLDRIEKRDQGSY